MADNILRQVIKHGQLTEVPNEEVEFEFESPSQLFNNTINLLPMQNAVTSQRAFYSNKFFTQAVPLVNGEAPFVQALKDKDTGETFEDYNGRLTGVVTADDDDDDIVIDSVDPDYIKYTNKTTGKKKVKSLYNNFAFNRKTGVRNIPLVKAGEEIKDAKNSLLARTNYTDNKGTLNMGLNARVGIVPYKGWTADDAIVISQDFANRMASEHIYSFKQEDPKELKTGKNHFTALFPEQFKKDQLDKIDDNGVVKVGSIVQPNDPLILSTAPRIVSSKDQVLGRLSKFLKNTRNDASQIWDHENPGVVTDVAKLKDGSYKVNVATIAPMKPGDKLTVRSGSKQTVSKVIPMNEMPRTSDGKPLDVLFNGLGLPSRVNSNLIFESLLGKIAEKTGNTYKLPSFNKPNESWIDFVDSELKKNNLTDTEEVFDPLAGRKLSRPITVGNVYLTKLHHMAESKYSARGQGKYDQNEQPMKGGEEGQMAKRQSMLENWGMLSAGAYDVIKDALHLRGQKNDDYWRAVRMGETPTLAKRSPFVWDKYIALMQGSGMNAITTPDGKLRASPFTDKQFNLLKPEELKNADIIDIKSLKPVEGGLFDPARTLSNKWSKITLPEPYPNPGFEDAIVSLLGIKKSDLMDIMTGKKSFAKFGTGNEAIKKALSSIDKDKMYNNALKAFKTAPKSKKQNALNRLKYIKGLNKNGLNPEDLMISQVPVLPAKFRPYAMMGDTFLPGDANELYKDVYNLKEANIELRNELGADNEITRENASKMYDSIKALYGFGDPMNKKLKERGVSGFMQKLIGGTSKFSQLNRNVLSHPVDFSARSVIGANPEISMDEMVIPKDMAFELYSPYIQRRLVGNGASLKDALQSIVNKDNRAVEALKAEMHARPILASRAPAWHKYNVIAAWPKIQEGKNILVNPITMTGAGGDFDGDCQYGYVIIAVPKT